jgi:hypothetical protein
VINSWVARCSTQPTAGLGIGDVTDQNAKAFAVWTENTLPQPGNSPYTAWNDGGMDIITIADLENRLNQDPTNNTRGIRYNFFSNLSSSVQQYLKTTPVTIPSGSSPYSAFLLAETSQPAGKLDVFSTNISIGHNSIIEDGASKIWPITGFGSSQITSSEVDVSHTSTFERGINESSIRQVGTIQGGQVETSPTQIRSLEIGLIQGSLTKMSIAQIGSTQINSIQHHFSQNSSTEIDASQIGTHQLVRGFNFNITEIPLSSSITLQQFLSSHNFNLQNTTIPTWTEFLTGTTPFNLKIEITDLPTGQLAEANITHFDPTGLPTSGTLTLDTDANGLGWFIDSTPWDNAEFGTLNAETFFRATPGSAAYGHYDLLTTILHELGHLAGLISGTPTYDDRVQLISGTPTFQGNGYNVTLTSDRSHLADPTKLMSTYLAPGMRKLPSQLELQMLADLRNSSSTRNPLANSSARQQATPMVGITNGQFDQLLTQWDTRGSIQVNAAAVTLREDDPLLANLSQTYPSGSKLHHPHRSQNPPINPVRLHPHHPQPPGQRPSQRWQRDRQI